MSTATTTGTVTIGAAEWRAVCDGFAALRVAHGMRELLPGVDQIAELDQAVTGLGAAIAMVERGAK